jgi:hypothetical protein
MLTVLAILTLLRQLIQPVLYPDHHCQQIILRLVADLDRNRFFGENFFDILGQTPTGGALRMLLDFFQFFGRQPYGKETLRRSIYFHLDEALKLKVLINVGEVSGGTCRLKAQMPEYANFRIPLKIGMPSSWFPGDHGGQPHFNPPAVLLFPLVIFWCPFSARLR